MSLRLNVRIRAYEILKQESEKKYTARELAEKIYEEYPDECRAKQKRSTAKKHPLDSRDELINQIAREIPARIKKIQEKDQKIKTIEGWPRRYYYTEKTDMKELSESESLSSDSTAEKVSEHDLYSVLTEYLRSEFEIDSSRINESTSKNSQGPNGNKWLHPDVVGIENLSKDWCQAIKKCVKEHSDKTAKLWSFEVKKRINNSNVREAFFQCVSNSSWANFAYLVASEITGTNTMNELRILSGLHGVGLINLNIESPSESQIIIPARERTLVDWDVANRLATENKDFEKYVKSVSLKIHEWQEFDR